MAYRICLTLILIFSSHIYASTAPVLYQGRFRPIDTYARLWLQERYQREAIRKQDLSAFSLERGEALSFLWALHLKGGKAFQEAPLFAVRQAELKKLLGLPLHQDRFSAAQLKKSWESSPSHTPFLHALIEHAFASAYLAPSNRNSSTHLELTSLSPGLWVRWNQQLLSVTQVPKEGLWSSLSPGTLSSFSFEALQAASQKSSLSDAAKELMAHVTSFLALPPASKEALLSSGESLTAPFSHPSPLFLALPSATEPGRWLPLEALALQVRDGHSGLPLPIHNFTPYSDLAFQKIREAYLSRSFESLLPLLLESYQEHLAQKPYRSASGKTLFYPSSSQLHAESFYIRSPLVSTTIVLYGLAFLALLLKVKRAPLCFFFAWAAHTSILAMRIFILGRAPVSNMFETILYVPWVAALFSLLLHWRTPQSWLLAAASFSSIALLIVLRITGLDQGLENVQAVLDSQYWLITHVLMVVGSYGVFLLASALAHFYLIQTLFQEEKSADLSPLLNGVLHCMYLGTGLLVCGTVLGGIWAAESWGRFWDWDPKESWAFISSCFYLIWIHLYRFRQIGERTLALGAGLGFLAITFTWYGVNYILGTGLHSYGFGSGGETLYYSFLLADFSLLLLLMWRGKSPLSTSTPTPPRG